jgi:hypothetical protein
MSVRDDLAVIPCGVDIPFIKNCEPSALKNLLPTASMGSKALTEVMMAANAEASEIPRMVKVL